MEIIKAPNPILSQKAKRISQINSAILDLIEEMKKALLAARDPEGVGLAAPQVGKSLQLFIIKQNQNAQVNVYINPLVTILEHADKTQQVTKKKASHKLEGCLSLQNIWGTVNRAHKVAITYQDEFGKLHKKTCTGFLATIIQHEYDHLHGILFPKRVLEQKEKLYKSKKNEKGEDVFEELTL